MHLFDTIWHCISFVREKFATPIGVRSVKRSAYAGNIFIIIGIKEDSMKIRSNFDPK